MRAIIQRVTQASVSTEGSGTGSIGRGLLILLGISKEDCEEDADYLVNKIAGLRIFPDDRGKMNLSLRDISGALLIVSNFTLYGDVRKGRRPSFDSAASPEVARKLYEYFVEKARMVCGQVETGVFQSHMIVRIENDGPVTLICDSQ